MRNLDLVYERLRKRARAEWHRSRVGADPSDACVSVQIFSGDGVCCPERRSTGGNRQGEDRKLVRPTESNRTARCDS